MPSKKKILSYDKCESSFKKKSRVGVADALAGAAFSCFGGAVLFQKISQLVNR